MAISFGNKNSDLEYVFKNKRRIKRAFRKAPKLAAKVFGKALKNSKAVLDKHNKKNDPTPVDSGNLFRSFEFNQQSNKRATYGPTVEYAKWVHEGTSPHYPPLSEIEGWAERHGIDPRALQQSIGQEGTEANPFLEKIMDNAEGDLDDLFEKALDEFTEKFANDIDPTNLN